GRRRRGGGGGGRGGSGAGGRGGGRADGPGGGCAADRGGAGTEEVASGELHARTTTSGDRGHAPAAGPDQTTSAASSTVSTRCTCSSIGRPLASARSSGQAGSVSVQYAVPTSTIGATEDSSA